MVKGPSVSLSGDSGWFWVGYSNRYSQSVVFNSGQKMALISTQRHGRYWKQPMGSVYSNKFYGWPVQVYSESEKLKIIQPAKANLFVIRI